MARQLEIPGTAKRGRKKIRTEAELREAAKLRNQRMRKRRQKRLEELEALRERVGEYLDAMAVDFSDPWSAEMKERRKELRKMLADLEGPEDEG